MVSELTDRRFLLEALARFNGNVRNVSGVLRIAVVGSLTTAKTSPKDADVLVTVRDDAELEALAQFGRRLKGTAQTRNLGADIFLADPTGHYIGRMCSFKECHFRRACRGTSCGSGNWICDDFQVLRLTDQLVAEPPLEVWPKTVVRVTLPVDAREILLGENNCRVSNRGAV